VCGGQPRPQVTGEDGLSITRRATDSCIGVGAFLQNSSGFFCVVGKPDSTRCQGAKWLDRRAVKDCRDIAPLTDDEMRTAALHTRQVAKLVALLAQTTSR
jgi:hypothetical protein